MAKFSSLTQGASARARKKIVFPLPGARWSPEASGWEGPTVDVDVRVLTPGEDEEVLRRAHAEAKTGGVEHPAEGEPIYDRAIVVNTVALALVDHESPETAPAPFFASADEIRASTLMSTEVLLYLMEQQELWQDERSPRIKDFTPAEFLATLVGVAGGNAGFFVGQRPGTQWLFMRTTCERYLTLLTQTSDGGSSSLVETSSAPHSTPIAEPAALPDGDRVIALGDAVTPPPEPEPEPA